MYLLFKVTEIGKKKLSVRMREVDAEELKRLWPLLVTIYSDYAGYQKKTSREIPIVILCPEHEVALAEK